MKEHYTAPEMEIITFDAEDVITTSWINGGEKEDYQDSKIDGYID